MPTCGGSACKNAVAWSISGTGLVMDGAGAAAVAFTFGDMKANLNALLALWGVTPASAGDPPVFCLCPSCWTKQASAWGNAESKPSDVYTGARAKTDADGVYLQVQDPAFNQNIASKEPAGKPQFEPIVSCLVHEVMHYWSAGSGGVSAHNRDSGVEWDEVFCDWIGFNVYQRMFLGKEYPGGKFASYIGPYGKNAQFVKQATQNWKTDLNIARNANDFLNKPQKRDELPRPLTEYFAKQGPTPAGPPGAVPKATHGDATADLYEKTLRKYCATWFFSGPGMPIEDEPNFAAFIRKKDTIFRRAGVVFPAFGETATPL